MQSRDNAVVLFSGGMDSTVCLWWARERYSAVHAVTVQYGQANRRELHAAERIGRAAGLASHVYVTAPLVSLGVQSSLLGAGVDALEGGYGGFPTALIPARNLVFLALAAPRAAILRADLVTGVGGERPYPDNSPAFIAAAEAAVNESIPESMRGVQIHAPLATGGKRRATELAVQYGAECMAACGLSVTCLRNAWPGCGECTNCVERAKEFDAAGVADPAVAAAAGEGAE